jgi:hypothetical protein
MRKIVSDEAQGQVFLLTPEDIVLAKLDWYRLGGLMSSKQWHDILGVLTVQQDRLDLAYMRDRAAELGVSDLLERALEESGCS